MKLLEALQQISYDSSWCIFAELSENGELTEDSEARYGQKQYEGGGMRDDFVYVCDGVFPSEYLLDWCEGCEGDCEWDWQFTMELIEQLNLRLNS